MSSYAITGASKGLGLEFSRQLAANPANTVLAIVRDRQSQRIAKLASEHPNLHLIEADVGDPQSILNASKVASTITDGKLDVLIHNSNAVDMETMAYSPSQFPFDAEAVRATFELPIRVAIYGGLWTTNSFLPLIERGTQKKIIHISSGMADLDLIKNTGISYALPYSVAKAGINVQVAKYAAELAPKDIKVLAISPGWVDTFDGEKPPEVKAAEAFMLEQFQKHDLTVKGQITPEESVRKQLDVIERLDADLSGSFVSHAGPNSWF